MNKLSNPILTPNAKRLRKAMTKEERHLWYDYLRQLPVMVHRQKTIGNYIVDFYVATEKLVIEIDGSQHYQTEGVASDRIRDEYLNSLGLTVVRYSNSDINCRFREVCQDIHNRLGL